MRLLTHATCAGLFVMNFCWDQFILVAAFARYLDITTYAQIYASVVARSMSTSNTTQTLSEGRQRSTTATELLSEDLRRFENQVDIAITVQPSNLSVCQFFPQSTHQPEPVGPSHLKALNLRS